MVLYKLCIIIIIIIITPVLLKPRINFLYQSPFLVWNWGPWNICFCVYFRDLVSSVAVSRFSGDHSVQPSWARIPPSASVHISGWQRKRLCKVSSGVALYRHQLLN